jgi:hypothetical protein
MPDQAPLTHTKQARVGALGATADAATQSVGEAPFDGTVTAATYTPDSTITGAATNNRTISLVNKGQAGTGTTVIATLTFNNGVNAAGDDETPMTLSGTPANLVVAAGDVLAFNSTHNGTGIADPGGLVQVTFSRS